MHKWVQTMENEISSQGTKDTTSRKKKELMPRFALEKMLIGVMGCLEGILLYVNV